MTPLLTKRDVANYLRVSTRTVDALCRRRALPFRLVGSRKRFSYEDLAVYLDHRRIPSSPASTI